MDMKFTLKPNGEVVLEWEKNGEKKKAELTYGITEVNINNIKRFSSTEVTLKLSVNEVDVQYATKQLNRGDCMSGELPKIIVKETEK